MAGNYAYRIKILIARLLPLYLLYFFCRILFFFINRDLFSSVPLSALFRDSWYGLRFDTLSIFAASSLFILLSVFPLKKFYSTWYQSLLKWAFIIPNSVFILFNCVDFAYYPFIKKRSGADLFKQVGGQTDMGHLLPQYIKDFWWVLLLLIMFIFLLIRLYKRVKIKEPLAVPGINVRQLLLSFLLFLVTMTLVVLGLRGGLQRIPIDIIDAGANVPVEEVSIVLNTPFTILKSLDKKELEEYHFYSPEELKSIYNPLHQFDSSVFRKKNVVVIILESFAKEYTRLGKTGISYTPFLDSLTEKSFVFTNGIANGNKSIEGVPAILSGLPHLMENPFINSNYSNNFQTSLANVLAKEDYHTAFFHGGINGTMNFDSYSKMAGYQDYFGKKEYNNDEDFDGFWGIWDEPFLQYSVKTMSEFKEPFHSSIFTLSSHHPYYVPKKYEGKFPKGTLDNSACIGYTDFALKLFFESAKKTKWYNNTLFVICADHTSLSDHNFYRNTAGSQAIPILFFSPGDSLKGSFDGSFAQVDILPSVLNLLGYNKPFFAFGQSYLKRKNNNCYFYANGNYMMIADSILAVYNHTAITALYNFRRDSSLTNNIAGHYPSLEASLTKDLRAFIQTYNSTLIHNTGMVK